MKRLKVGKESNREFHIRKLEEWIQRLYSDESLDFVDVRFVLEEARKRICKA